MKEEYRFFLTLNHTSEENGFYFYNFEDDLKLTEVILGCESKTDTLDVKRRLLTYNQKIEMYDGIKNEAEFKIEKSLINF